jgi:septal ring factor EnvC (AmiA/AmiB activator)
MRKAVTGLAGFWERKEADEVRSDTYLINRGLTVMLVAVVLVGLLILAGGLAGAVTSLVPDKSVREQIAQVSKELKAATSEFQQAQASLADEQKRWERDRAAIVQAARDNSSRERDRVTRDLNALAGQLTAEALFGEVQRELGPVSGQPGPQALEQRKEQAQRTVSGRFWWDARSRDRLLRYIKLWLQASLADYAAKFLPEDAIGQSRRAELQQRVEQLQGPMVEKQQEHKALYVQVWAPLAAFPLKLLLTVVAFFGFIWVMGTMVEWIGLFVRLADNVRAIRERGM